MLTRLWPLPASDDVNQTFHGQLVPKDQSYFLHGIFKGKLPLCLSRCQCSLVFVASLPVELGPLAQARDR